MYVQHKKMGIPTLPRCYHRLFHPLRACKSNIMNGFAGKRRARLWYCILYCQVNCNWSALARSLFCMMQALELKACNEAWVVFISILEHLGVQRPALAGLIASTILPAIDADLFARPSSISSFSSTFPRISLLSNTRWSVLRRCQSNTTEILHVGTFAGYIGHRPLRPLRWKGYRLRVRSHCESRKVPSGQIVLSPTGYAALLICTGLSNMRAQGCSRAVRLA